MPDDEAQHINKDIVNETFILYHLISVVNDFNQIIEKMFDEILIIEKQNANLKQTRDLLLRNLSVENRHRKPQYCTVIKYHISPKIETISLFRLHMIR